MQRKMLIKVGILVIVLMFIIAVLVVSQNIEVVENIKQNLLKQVENATDTMSEDNLNTTVIDVTGLSIGKDFKHDCNDYLISSYDETNHWNECKICHEKYNIIVHNLIDNGWIMGNSSNCNESNVHNFSCICGYNCSNSDGRRAHTFTSEWNPDGCYKRDYCTLCRYSKFDHYCILNNDERIICTNLGTCKICRHTYTASSVWHACYNITGTSYCNKCNQEIVTLLDKEVLSVDKVNSKVKFKITVLLPQGTIPIDVGPLVEGTFGRGCSATKTTSSRNENSSTIITYEITMNCGSKQYMRRI